MSEERKMILQMLAEGKITTDEADTLLQAIEESEQTAEEVVVEKAQRTERTADGLSGLGGIIDEAMTEAARALDETFRSLEDRLKHDEAKQEQLRRRVEDRIRRSTEQALERALQAEERATRAAERAAARAEEQAERVAARMQEQAERLARKAEATAGKVQEKIFKVGVSIDKESVERTERLSLPAEPGDRLQLESRVGDIEVEFYEGQTIEVEVRKQVWGNDEADVIRRADSTKTELVRDGALVKVQSRTPSISVVGFAFVKDARLDYKVRLPYGTHLDLSSKAGEIRVTGDGPITTWNLESKVGDIDLCVPSAADFDYDLKSRVGEVTVKLDQDPVVSNEGLVGGTATGRCGSGQGQIQARTEVGDIRLHH